MQLDPAIPVYVVSKAMRGYAVGWIDYSQEHDLLWIVGLDNGEVWTVGNPDIRLQHNLTMGRKPA